jgi:hypothetical protein
VGNLRASAKNGLTGSPIRSQVLSVLGAKLANGSHNKQLCPVQSCFDIGHEVAPAVAYMGITIYHERAVARSLCQMLDDQVRHEISFERVGCEIFRRLNSRPVDPFVSADQTYSLRCGQCLVDLTEGVHGLTDLGERCPQVWCIRVEPDGREVTDRNRVER